MILDTELITDGVEFVSLDRALIVLTVFDPIKPLALIVLVSTSVILDRPVIVSVVTDCWMNVATPHTH